MMVEGSGSAQIVTDPDPGGPNTSGSGSTTLVQCLSFFLNPYFFLFWSTSLMQRWSALLSFYCGSFDINLFSVPRTTVSVPVKYMQKTHTKNSVVVPCWFEIQTGQYNRNRPVVQIRIRMSKKMKFYVFKNWMLSLEQRKLLELDSPSWRSKNEG